MVRDKDGFVTLSLVFAFAVESGLVHYEEKGTVKNSYLLLPSVTRADDGKYRWVLVDIHFTNDIYRWLFLFERRVNIFIKIIDKSVIFVYFIISGS